MLYEINYNKQNKRLEIKHCKEISWRDNNDPLSGLASDFIRSVSNRILKKYKYVLVNI